MPIMMLIKRRNIELYFTLTSFVCFDPLLKLSIPNMSIGTYSIIADIPKPSCKNKPASYLSYQANMCMEGKDTDKNARHPYTVTNKSKTKL